MSGLIGKAMKFARSPAGRKAMQKAKGYASSPEGKKRIDDARGRVEGLRGGAKEGQPQAELKEPPVPPAEQASGPTPDPKAPGTP